MVPRYSTSPTCHANTRNRTKMRQVRDTKTWPQGAIAQPWLTGDAFKLAIWQQTLWHNNESCKHFLLRPRVCDSTDKSLLALRLLPVLSFKWRVSRGLSI